MYRRIQIHPELCTACGLCSQICSTTHSGMSGPHAARIWVFTMEEGTRFVPFTCTQCDDAFCMKACPTGAITEDPVTKVKKVNPDVCIGCRMCTMACPIGAITYHAPTGKAIKCDECDGEPLCVAICPTGALTYEAPAARDAELRRRAAAKVLTSFEG